ncbi:MAG: hypothetical protein K0R15_1166 [Clostridiales bacterium]|nr:hypothetical protein [Clostridiales bacterium]
MANKTGNNENLNSDEKGKGGLFSALIGVGLVFAIIITLLLLIKFNVGGFASTMLRPMFGDVKAISWMLPKEEKVEYVDLNYPYETIEEAIARIKELEVELATANKAKDEKVTSIEDLQTEIARLKVFEDKHTEYIESKKTFDDEVVFNAKAPDIAEYKAYYELINPVNAEEIYRQVVEQLAVEEEIQKVAKAYQEMKPAQAASVLEELSSNVSLVVDILRNVNTEQRAKILGAMDPTIAAKITKAMSQ